ncbi:universal stress protein [Catenulispora pinisilvae]|uniref:universal stress protein n=1 Tax=Catenulispora pinisilvae TaxID=2705253 RepID=UPI001890F183|nr:universal stress protein [Catenulispora pinisilvae]
MESGAAMESGVVVGYDQRPAGERALAEAAAEADRREVPLMVIHALHHAPAAPPETSATQDPVDQAADQLRADHPGLAILTRELEGPTPTILAEQSSDADLLVLGHHGRDGFLRPGSVARHTVARATCPALVVRGSEHRTRGTVVAAVDIGDSAAELLDFAYAEAAARGARLKAVSAPGTLWPRVYTGDAGPLGRAPTQAAERAEEALEQVLQPWPDQYPDVVTDHELIEGSPTAFLTGATTYADLIVVGAHRRADGRPGMRVGPVAQTLLLHADCPVALVPHD